jgi:hypothetical protein
MSFYPSKKTNSSSLVSHKVFHKPTTMSRKPVSVCPEYISCSEHAIYNKLSLGESIIEFLLG